MLRGNRACAANGRLKSSIATLICAALFALSGVRNTACRLRTLSRMTHRRMKTCASYNDVIRTVVATSGRCASKWRSKGKVILEISWRQVVRDTETPVTVDPGRDLVDPGAVAIEDRQQSLLAPRGAGGKLLQGRYADEK